MNGNADDPHTVTFARDLDEVVDIVPRPNGGPGEFIFATTLVDPSRRPGGPVEEYREGGYFNSGIMFGYQVGADVPMIDTFSMKFPEPGIYQYICGIHEFHRGTVVVKEATDPDLPTQEDIDRAARLQMEFGMGIVNSLQSLVAQETTRAGRGGRAGWNFAVHGRCRDGNTGGRGARVLPAKPANQEGRYRHVGLDPVPRRRVRRG